MKKRSFKITVLILLTLLSISLILYLSWGSYKILPLDIVKTLLGQGTKLQNAALLNNRIPRMLVGISVGIALSTAGALLQTITKNELADSGIIGINAGAAVAAIIFISLKTEGYYSELGALSIYVLPFMSILGAGISAIIIYFLSSRDRVRPKRLLLIGLGINVGLNAFITLEKLASANGIIQQVGSIVNLLGPISAGLLYSFIGIKAVVILNAISFLLSAILELFLDIPNLEVKEKFKNPLLKSITEMKKSFIYLKEKKKVVLGIIVSYGLTNIFVVPILSVVTPYFINIKMNMPSSIYGFVESIFVLGMIIGGLIITFRPKLFKMKKLHKTMYPMIIAIIIMGIATYLNTENKLLVLGLYSIGGFGIMLSLALSNIISLTHIQEEVKENMLGKVSAFSTAVATVSVTPGQLIYGQLIDLNFSLFNILILTTIFSIGVVMFIKWNVRKI